MKLCMLAAWALQSQHGQIHKCHEQCCPLYINFVDFTKAFDMASRDELCITPQKSAVYLDLLAFSHLS